MSESRVYTCLVCEERPVFHGKIGAAMHLRAAHAALLEEHHPDELLLQGPEYEPPEPEGPFICLIEHARGDVCGQKRDNVATMESHLSAMHGVTEPELACHYVSVDQYDKGDYGKVARPLTAGQLATAEAFARVMRSVDTVRDFLTECRA